MAAAARISYERLKQEISFEDDGRDLDLDLRYLRGSSNYRLRRVVRVRRKLRVLKLPSRVRRLLSRRARALKAAWLKVCGRLKESQSHFGDIFAGNYLFMQVTPTPLKTSLDRNRYKSSSFVCYNQSNDNKDIRSTDASREFIRPSPICLRLGAELKHKRWPPITSNMR